MLTVLFILAVAALISAIAAIMARCPLYVSVLILTVIELLRHIPLGR